MRRLVILGICFSVSFSVVAGDFCGPNSSMGRWVPDEFSTPMSERVAHFGQACAVHDACYQSRGSTRAHCDFQFNRNLHFECDMAFSGMRNFSANMACHGTASGYAAMARQFGQRYFDASQRNPALFFWR